jgi:hypothetical protein
MTRIYLILCAVILLTACESTPRLERNKPTLNEYEAFSTREYKGVTKEEVLKAGEELLRISTDIGTGDYLEFLYVTNNETTVTLLAVHGWIQYGLFTIPKGRNFWKLVATSNNNSIIATIQINRFDIPQYIVSENPFEKPLWVSDKIPKSVWPSLKGYSLMTYRVLHDLYWARMDYLLGKRNDWVTCEMSNAKVEEYKQKGIEEYDGLLCYKGQNVSPTPLVKPKI